MTLAVRNTVVSLGAIISLGFVALSALVGYQAAGWTSFSGATWLQSWALWNWEVPHSQVFASVAVAGVVAVLSATALTVSSRVFRRVSSSELYFFLLFLLALSFESLRVVQLYFVRAGVPPVYGVMLTRLIVAARVGGAITLFAASLYAVGVEYPRIGSVTLGVAVAALVFVTLVPVDTLLIQATLLHRLKGQASLEISMLVLGLLSLVNYIIAGVRGHRERGGMITLSAVLLVTGSQLIWFAPALGPALAAASALAGGTVVFLVVTRAHYLWY